MTIPERRDIISIMRDFWPSVLYKLNKFIYVQLHITLFTIPILMAWGLPLSIMSPISNLLLTPFLMVYLFLCSLIFFTQFFSIPNELLYTLFNKSSNYIMKVMQFHHPSWLIGFSKQTWFITMLGLCGAFYVLHARAIPSLTKKNGYNALILIMMIVMLKTIEKQQQCITTITCGNKSLYIARINQKTIMIDTGALGRTALSDSWIEYTLFTELNRFCGTTTINHLITTRPTSCTLDILQSLAATDSLKNIHLIHWHGNAEPSFLKKYGKLLHAMQQHNVTMHRFGAKPITYTVGNNNEVIVQPMDKTNHYKNLRFAQTGLTLNLHQKTYTFSS